MFSGHNSVAKIGGDDDRQDTSAPHKSRRRTWAEEVSRYECGSHSSLNSSLESLSSDVNRQSFASECEIDDRKSNLGGLKENENNSSADREISLEFIEDANEEKFERLINEDKMKNSFKRRYSLSRKSRSSSSNSSLSDVEDKQFKVEKRARHNSYESSTSSTSANYPETDPGTLARRQKQIDYGKNTLAYERYVEMVPKSQRSKSHPSTPDKYGKYSRRAFDGLVKIWRKKLHCYDPPNDEEINGNQDSR